MTVARAFLTLTCLLGVISAQGRERLSWEPETARQSDRIDHWVALYESAKPMTSTFIAKLKRANASCKILDIGDSPVLPSDAGVVIDRISLTAKPCEVRTFKFCGQLSNPVTSSLKKVGWRLNGLETQYGDFSTWGETRILGQQSIIAPIHQMRSGSGIAIRQRGGYHITNVDRILVCQYR